MKRASFILVAFIFWALVIGPGHAQSPYQFSFGKEAAFLGVGGAALVSGVLLKDQTALFTPGELERLDPIQVNAFDRGAIYNSSQSARDASDFFLNGSHLLPLFLLAGQPTRRDFGRIAFLWGETLLVNGGLTMMSKYAFRRPRPYVYNMAIDAQEKQNVNARTAFYSGHTSMTAANAFFAAKVFSDYYPDSKWRPVVWATAATIPAITGYLRVKAGRHYPTDVIAGYAAGALAGYFVPHLHKRAGLRDKGVELYGGVNGALLRVVF
ncbi:MAG: phosphatase PAP2 family protein [Phaeodactylibacter sp.]|nr:phosphatase PAP2 family protein [Phaeodactylibacter sp.]MCB0616491.1 phosphatase PAP2 family protein [Phaeodactylibacter sp.]